MLPLPCQGRLAGGDQCDKAFFRAVSPNPQHRARDVPDVGVIVQREAEIDTFQPIPFYTVALELPGLTVSAGRMADKVAAEQLKEACQGANVNQKGGVQGKVRKAACPL